MIYGLTWTCSYLWRQLVKVRDRPVFELQTSRQGTSQHGSNKDQPAPLPTEQGHSSLALFSPLTNPLGEHSLLAASGSPLESKSLVLRDLHPVARTPFTRPSEPELATARRRWTDSGGEARCEAFAEGPGHSGSAEQQRSWGRVGAAPP